MKKRKFYVVLITVLVLAYSVFALSGCTPKSGETPPVTVSQSEVYQEKVTSEPATNTESSESLEDEKKAPSDAEMICSLTVRCDAVLAKMDKLKEEKRGFVPDSGILFSSNTVTFEEGDSVFDVLKRELERAGIALQFTKSVMYNSIYIQGIGNLCEFDCGDSGWVYTVNGESPFYGSSQYMVSNGDVIEFTYICR